jgi:hypothetical protein
MLNPKSQRNCLWVCLMVCYSFFLHDFGISALDKSLMVRVVQVSHCILLLVAVVNCI